MLFLFFFLFVSIISSAQTLSTTPDVNFPFATGVTYQAFEMPTATDALKTNGGPVQVTVSSSSVPYPEFHYNYNNGAIVGSGPVGSAAAFSGRHIYLDDVVLAYNGSNLYAYITCRAENGNNTTDIYIVQATFNGSSFNIIPTPLYIGTRPELTQPDYFDRVSIAHDNFVDGTAYSDEIGIAYNNNGDITVKSGKINWGTGNIDFTLGVSSLTLFDGNSVAYPGRFSNPDIATGDYGHFCVSALYEYGINDSRIMVGVSDHAPYNDVAHFWYYNTAYTTTCPGRKIRTPRIDEVQKYEFALCFNELDMVNRKSNIVLIARYGSITQGGVDISSPSAPLIINSELEGLCDNNNNYLLTGFPVVKYLDENYSRCEVVWQQIACTAGGTDYCRINAISKRFKLTYNPLPPVITPENNNNFFYISNNLQKNTVFPSFAAMLDGLCSNYYSVGKMDVTTSANGEVDYKQSACNGASLRPFNSLIQNNAGVIVENLKDKPVLYAYPNPAKDVIHVSVHGFKGNTQVYLYNATGGLLKTISARQKNIFDINAERLASGNYLIKVIDEDGVAQYKKIIIIK